MSGRGARRARSAGAGLILLMAASAMGCGPPAPPEPIEFVPGHRTATGLRQVIEEENGVVLVRPGVRLADYTELIVEPFMLSYTVAAEPGDEPVRTLDPDDEARFKSVMRDAFVRELRRSAGFTVVDRPGPAALRVHGWLYELVLDEPPTDDRRNIPLCDGRLAVLLMIRDSETAQPIAEIGDMKQLQCPVKPSGYATTTWSAVGRGVGPWAARLRSWLERLHALPPVEG